MMQKLKLIADFISNMGYRYLFFRVSYSIKTKLGWQRKIFPINPEFKSFISLTKWRSDLPPFFFNGKNIEGLSRDKTDALQANFKDIRSGIITFFSKEKINLGKDFDWITNPTTGHRYDISKHWSSIADLSKDAGDIKFVWEKSRFSYLYDVIRYDYHFEDDQSKFVFDEIENFIDNNPINQGPNYKCSQEISLRILNWTFALYYYKDSIFLTQNLFDKIIHAIYWQVHHVYRNINFSRISVRNNHAITETLLLYLSGKLFPFLPNVKKWSSKGKEWFEQEIEYQIYPDGTFLQFSMNYHRVVIQLLTWGIQLAKLNGDSFKEVVYERAEKSLHFLDTCLDEQSGKLPNYGANDGALFFKLTNDDYRVYRSQLDDLRAVLFQTSCYNSQSHYWYGITKLKNVKYKAEELNCFDNGGYYVINENKVKTFIRCGKYKDRPSQSDNLHIDIWVNGENLLRDSGSYKYNTSVKELNFFNGVQGHNTVSVANNNQMLKGGRFIWFYWVKKVAASLVKTNQEIVFKGKINAFRQLSKNIVHNRIIYKKESAGKWVVFDSVDNKRNQELFQFWNLPLNGLEKIRITTLDQNGNELIPKIEEKWYSGYYGVKEKSLLVTFTTKTNEFKTTIKLI